jgi:hypothetical protein
MLDIMANAGGSTIPSQKTEYDSAEVVIITAYPDSCYIFSH